MGACRVVAHPASAVDTRSGGTHLASSGHGYPLMTAATSSGGLPAVLKLHAVELYHVTCGNIELVHRSCSCCIVLQLLHLFRTLMLQHCHNASTAHLLIQRPNYQNVHVLSLFGFSLLIRKDKLISC